MRNLQNWFKLEETSRNCLWLVTVTCQCHHGKSLVTGNISSDYPDKCDPGFILGSTVTVKLEGSRMYPGYGSSTDQLQVNPLRYTLSANLKLNLSLSKILDRFRGCSTTWILGGFARLAGYPGFRHFWHHLVCLWWWAMTRHENYGRVLPAGWC